MEQTTSLSTREGHSSGVSWGAVIAGAFVAAALSLTLLALGAGFGLLTVSPWSNRSIGASAAGAAAICWLIVIQIAASSMGGYLCGRLRIKWVAIHTHEVFFRDTAHGFLAWAVAVVITAAFLGSAASAMVGRGGEDTGTAALERDYFVDTLFRPAPNLGSGSPNAAIVVPADPTVRHEAAVILANSLRQTESNTADQDYLTKVVVTRTGLTQADAAQRVSDVITRVRQAADAARRAAARLLLWTFIALLAGAFCASYAATIGGRQRDHVPAL